MLLVNSYREKNDILFMSLKNTLRTPFPKPFANTLYQLWQQTLINTDAYAKIILWEL